MQNWKIKKMSISKINSWLQAIGFLLRCYEKRKRFEHCPLCDIAGCLDCLWRIIEGTNCLVFAIKLGISCGTIQEMRECEKWRIVRIPMLKRWKEVLMTELEGRGK